MITKKNILKKKSSPFCEGIIIFDNMSSRHQKYFTNASQSHIKAKKLNAFKK
jgi:hypothetical protein